jgi:hypothetical protein
LFQADVTGTFRRVEVRALIDEHPRLYHMAEAVTWPSIQAHGLLSTAAIVDLYRPSPELAARILRQVRRGSLTLTDTTLGSVTIRDQRR